MDIKFVQAYQKFETERIEMLKEKLEEFLAIAEVENYKVIDQYKLPQGSKEAKRASKVISAERKILNGIVSNINQYSGLKLPRQTQRTHYTISCEALDKAIKLGFAKESLEFVKILADKDLVGTTLAKVDKNEKMTDIARMMGKLSAQLDDGSFENEIAKEEILSLEANLYASLLAGAYGKEFKDMADTFDKTFKKSATATEASKEIDK